MVVRISCDEAPMCQLELATIRRKLLGSAQVDRRHVVEQVVVEASPFPLTLRSRGPHELISTMLVEKLDEPVCIVFELDWPSPSLDT